ncbi:MAG: zinc ABC transporter substrate-binding protein [Ruminococcaceae bacterium]|nr:zinc ABC transporter substrate-binding protein [Oscillospiraceae bacterium]
MLALRTQKEKFMKIRKYISYVLLLALVAGLTCLVSCSDGRSGKRKIVCSAFAQYDFTLNILGEKAEDFDVIYLLENGSDMHSYANSVSASDKLNILSSELFICIGGESEKWVDEMLDDKNAENIRVLRLINEVGETLCHEGDGHTHGEDNSHECDEHIWLSPKRASLMCDAICKELCVIDPDAAEVYRENAKAYKEKLSELDEDYEETVNSAKINYLVFADRFPFLYMTNDYGINYSAAFDGCSTETGASFETVRRLASDIKSSGTKVLLTLEKSGVNIIDTLKNEVGDTQITSESVNSLQSVSRKDIDGGLTYLSAMRKNLEAFRKAMV